MLAWAISMHKAQGMTIPYLDLSFSGVFEYGQGYVALSRATDLEGLILRNFDSSRVKTHSKVIQFYKTMGFDVLQQQKKNLSELELARQIVSTTLADLSILYQFDYKKPKPFRAPIGLNSNENSKDNKSEWQKRVEPNKSKSANNINNKHNGFDEYIYQEKILPKKIDTDVHESWLSPESKRLRQQETEAILSSPILPIKKSIPTRMMRNVTLNRNIVAAEKIDLTDDNLQFSSAKPVKSFQQHQQENQSYQRTYQQQPQQQPDNQQQHEAWNNYKPAINSTSQINKQPFQYQIAPMFLAHQSKIQSPSPTIQVPFKPIFTESTPSITEDVKQ